MHLLKSTEARRQCCLTQRINHQWWTFKLKEKDFFPRFFWVCCFVLFWRSVFEESSNTSISLTNHCPCYKLAGAGGNQRRTQENVPFPGLLTSILSCSHSCARLEGVVLGQPPCPTGQLTLQTRSGRKHEWGMFWSDSNHPPTAANRTPCSSAGQRVFPAGSQSQGWL